MQYDVVELQGVAAGLRSTVDGLQSEVARLQGENAERQGRIDDLSAETERLSGELQSIRSTKSYRFYKACKTAIMKIKK